MGKYNSTEELAGAVTVLEAAIACLMAKRQDFDLVAGVMSDVADTLRVGATHADANRDFETANKLRLMADGASVCALSIGDAISDLPQDD